MNDPRDPGAFTTPNEYWGGSPYPTIAAGRSLHGFTVGGGGGSTHPNTGSDEPVIARTSDGRALNRRHVIALMARDHETIAERLHEVVATYRYGRDAAVSGSRVVFSVRSLPPDEPVGVRSRKNLPPGSVL